MIINKKILMLMTCLTVGCNSVPQDTVLVSSSLPSELSFAKKAFASGQLHVAKKQTENFLKRNPSHQEGQKLMAEILNEEIATHKEAFEEKTTEEFSKDEKKAEIKTWLERGKSLLELGEYDEATRAVENVFVYDAQNAEASRLLDRIRQQAWSAGKQEIMDGSEIVKAEVEDRATIYRKQAKNYMSAGQWGAAQMSVQKLLLLYPEDEEGHKLLDQIKSNQQSAAKATRS